MMFKNLLAMLEVLNQLKSDVLKQLFINTSVNDLRLSRTCLSVL